MHAAKAYFGWTKLCLVTLCTSSMMCIKKHGVWVTSMYKKTPITNITDLVACWGNNFFIINTSSPDVYSHLWEDPSKVRFDFLNLIGSCKLLKLLMIIVWFVCIPSSQRGFIISQHLRAIWPPWFRSLLGFHIVHIND